MECMVYAKQRCLETTSKPYQSSGGNYSAQSLYNNWKGKKGTTMPDGVFYKYTSILSEILYSNTSIFLKLTNVNTRTI